MIPEGLSPLHAFRLAASLGFLAVAIAWGIRRRERLRSIAAAARPLGWRRWILAGAALSVVQALAFSAADLGARAWLLRGAEGAEEIRGRILGPSQGFLDRCARTLPAAEGAVVVDPVYPWFVNYALYPRPLYLPPEPVRGDPRGLEAWARRKGARWILSYPAWNDFDPERALIEALPR